MKRVNLKIVLVVAAFLIAAAWPAPSFVLSSVVGAAQDSTSALERGWRTGYSDGYQSGYGDSSEKAPRDFNSKEDYRRADRAYAQSYGPLEDYKDGYRQGFEIGYSAGYEHRGFDSTVPTGLKRRGTTSTTTTTAPTTASTQANPTSANDDAGYSDSSTSNSSSSSNSSSRTVSNTTAMRGTVLIPRDTVMRVELLTNLSTAASQAGDRFQARIVEPAEYEGAMVDGRITRVKRAGRVKGTSELQLSIEQIRLPDSRFAKFNAQVIEVVYTQGTGSATGTGEVDPEGGVKGRDSTKRDVVKIGTGTAIGAIIGAIAGGGKGAAIGAAIGGAIGTGGVLSQKGEDIILPRGQQLRIRTNSETRIQ